MSGAPIISSRRPALPSAGVRARAPSAYEVQALQFQYPSSRPEASSWVLDRLTFTVAAGEILGIVGPNGSGKSSLLKLLAKVVRPHAGAITLLGQALESWAQEEVARTVAYVAQESPHFFPFTVMETVLMGRFPYCHATRWGFGWEQAGDLAIAEQAVRATDLTHVAGRLVRDLSGGERQRCLIARALAQTPQVLLLDEPTAFLDLQHQMDICAIVRRMHAECGLTVVLVTHDLNLASQYCDRILLLKAGALFRLGTPQEVISAEVLRAVYGCDVLIDRHPDSGVPRVTLPQAPLTPPL